MSRIVYLLTQTRQLTGGQKIIIRHVEALGELGFDAVIRIPARDPVPAWLSHNVPVMQGGALAESDIVVIPEDATHALERLASSPNRKIVFCQNHYYAASGIGSLSTELLDSYRDFMACSQTTALWISRFLPHDTVTIVPAFADERRFTPCDPKERIIACTPRKRARELKWIRFMFSRLYKGEGEWTWAALSDASEEQVADTLGRSSVFLSLNRFEGLGMTSLEAMVSGCVVAGFTGLGGREYATTTNGFWVEEDDCEGCARALVRAADLVETGGAGLELMKSAAEEAAAKWSRANFVQSLERFWEIRAPRKQLATPGRTGEAPTQLSTASL